MQGGLWPEKWTEEAVHPAEGGAVALPSCRTGSSSQATRGCEWWAGLQVDSSEKYVGISSRVVEFFSMSFSNTYFEKIFKGRGN
jgi:hypothetical protein